jgi:hypothetical protein
MRVLWIFFCAVLLLPAWAQSVLNNNAPRVTWQKINTPNFRVIYPAGFDMQGQRVANTLEHIRKAGSRTMGVETKRISVILQNQNSISNGFVSLVPRRSEWYTMPSQDYNYLNGTTDWIDALAVHEFRHVAQFDRSNTGFNKLLYTLFGPATLAAMGQLAAPAWFWEGDAVVMETAITPGGRGRIPNFNLLFHTNLMEGRSFNYHKQYLRSYKHNIPNHYVLGYNMVGYLRNKTNDPMIWEKITGRSWRVPFIPFAFSNAIKKETGMHVTDLYKQMADDLTREWKEKLNEVSLTDYTSITPRATTAYTDYQFPQVLPDGRVLTLKSGIGDISQFSILEEGKEKKSFIPGIVNESGMLSTAGNSVVWNEFGFHPRWRMQTWSVIKLYDLENKRLKFVTYKTRYTGAALAPDLSKIATIESTVDYKFLITLIDTAGQVLHQFPNPENAFYSMPRFSPDGTELVVLKTLNSKRTIASLNVMTGEEKLFFPYVNENIGHPVMHDHYVFYNSPVSGIDNIYVYDIRNNTKRQVTSSKYGSYNPVISPDGKWMYYNEQTRDGMDVVRIPFDPAAWRTFDAKPDPKSFFQLLTEQEGRPNLFDSIPKQDFVAGRYHKASGIINPYSWGVYFDTGLTQADIGLSSQDILSTTELKAGYLYDINERTGAWRFGVSYQNWFPIIDFNVTYGNRKLDEGDLTYFKIIEDDTIRATDRLILNWKESNVEGGIRLPLITTNSRYIGNFSLANYIGYTRTEELTNTITGTGRIVTPQLPVYWNRSIVGEGNLVYNHFIMSAYRLLKQSRRDIYSKWGQSFIMHLYDTPFGGDYTGKQFSFYTTLFFPGLFKHHSFWGYWGYQSTAIDLLSRSNTNQSFEDNGSYIFRNQIPLPRGQTVFRAEKFYSMSANYTLPIWYPDIALGPVVNLQRFRGNAFVDYGFGNSTFTNRSVSETYVTVGAEIRLDLNIMRLLNQFDIGFRFSYGLQPQNVTRFEFLLGTINF